MALNEVTLMTTAHAAATTATTTTTTIATARTMIRETTTMTATTTTTIAEVAIVAGQTPLVVERHVTHTQRCIYTEKISFIKCKFKIPDFK